MTRFVLVSDTHLQHNFPPNGRRSLEHGRLELAAIVIESLAGPAILLIGAALPLPSHDRGAPPMLRGFIKRFFNFGLKRPPRVLVVEDEKEIAALLESWLCQEGYEVDVAYNGRDGLAAARKFRPDVILLNGLMPVMDGWTALRELRADPELPRFPVIMTSGSRATESMIRETGADDFLYKPFGPEALLKSIRSALNARP